MATYTYVVADLLTGAVKDEIPFTGVNYSFVLNGPGAFNGNIEYRHPKATRANIDPARTALYVKRDGAVVWGGIIWSVRRVIGTVGAGDALQIGAEGFWSYYRRRTIRWSAEYESQDQFVIVRDLLIKSEALPGGSLGLVMPPISSGVLRSVTYNHYERKNLATAIETLSSTADGFDFAIDVSEPTNNNFSRMLSLHYPRRGARTPVTFDHQSNVLLMDYVLDGKRCTNFVDAIGANEGDSAIIATAADTNLLASYPMLEGTLPNKDMTDFGVLDALARRELAAKRLPPEIPKLTVRTSADSIVGSFREGDEVLLRVNDGFVKIDGYFRIQSYVVKVSNEGAENIEITFVDSDTYS